MLWAITVLLLVVWVVALISGVHAGVGIHAVLAVAIVIMAIGLIRTRRANSAA